MENWDIAYGLRTTHYHSDSQKVSKCSPFSYFGFDFRPGAWARDLELCLGLIKSLTITYKKLCLSVREVFKKSVTNAFDPPTSKNTANAVTDLNI